MVRRLPPLLALRVFECAARHLSFTKAAEELCVTQSAVSHQIRALETWFGKSLFKRLNRSLKLTAEGERLLGPMTGALDIMAEATSDIAQDDGSQVLNVSVPDSFASVWILPRLQSFHERFSNIDVRFVSTPVEEDNLGSGHADMEIRYGNGTWPGLHVYKFLDEEIYPVCSPKLLEGRSVPKSLNELEEFELLHDVMSIDWELFLKNFGVKSINVRRGFGFNHSQLVVQACIESNGFALGRGALVADALEKGTLVRPFKETMPADLAYYIVCRSGDSDESVIKAFSYWLMDEIEAASNNGATAAS